MNIVICLVKYKSVLHDVLIDSMDVYFWKKKNPNQLNSLKSIAKIVKMLHFK